MKHVAITAPIHQTHTRTILWDMLCALFDFVGKLSTCMGIMSARIVRKVARFYWQHKIRFGIDVVVTIMFVAVVMAGHTMYQATVDAHIKHEVVSGIDHYTPQGSKRDFRRSVASETSREFMNAGASSWLRQVTIETIFDEARRARMNQVETAVLLAIASVESGFNPLAKAPTTTACGTFQFIRDTGADYGLSDSTCFNPTLNVRAQVKHFRAIIGQSKVQQALQDKSTTERLVFMFREVYCRHHDGEHMKVCSTLAKSLTADSLPMLFGAYHVLDIANKRAEQASFWHVVHGVLNTMYAQVTAQVDRVM